MHAGFVRHVFIHIIPIMELKVLLFYDYGEDR